MYKREFMIGEIKVGGEAPCFIIAEAGSNHNGDLKEAMRLVDAAVDAGADAVKFQFFTADKIAADTSEKIAILEDGKTLHQLYKENEAPITWIEALSSYCEDKGIIFCATPFDEGAAHELERHGAKFYKVASFEIVHIPLIRELARFNKPVIISSGMADLEDIDDALEAMVAEGNDQVAILHCGISYPEPFDEVNLLAMDTIANKGVIVGYSDHTIGITVPISAAARGAKIIEKHFTLSRDAQGPDHSFALEPDELKAMVAGIRQCEAALGDGVKRRTKSEEVHFHRGRRGTFAARDIPAGKELEWDDVAVLRPGLGMKPKKIYDYIGREIQQQILKNEPLREDLF